MQWGAGVSTCKLGGGARVKVVGNGRQECLAYIAWHYLELDSKVSF